MRAEVKQDRDGIWYARPYIGTDALGRQIKPYRRFPNASTREEAQALADTWASTLTADGRVRSARLFDLLEDYVDLRERNGASPNTVKSYRLFTRNYVSRYLGTANARDLSVMDLNRFEQRLLAPKEDGGQGLARNSVLNVHSFLRGAFNHLVNAGVCDANPMVYVAKPSPERVEAFVLDEFDFATVDAALESEIEAAAAGESSPRSAAHAFAAWLVLRTGLRCGEVCAVHAREVNRMARFVHVGGTVIETKGRKPFRRNVTKGRKCRNVTVTERDVETIDGFRSLMAGAVGDFGPDSPLVTVDGSYMRPSTVSEAFSALRDRLGLPKRLTFHGLRHTHATWCLMNGVDLKTLSERLGHADEATTLRIYAHVLPGRDAFAASAFETAADRAKGGVTKA